MKVLTCDMQSDTFTKDFVSSLRNTGFAVIVNHGIAKENMDALYKKWAGVFAEEKVKQIYLYDKQSQAGYFPFKSENAKGSTKKDLKEFWHIYCNRPDWKETVPLMSEGTVRRVFRPLEKLAIQLLDVLEAQTPGEMPSKAAIKLYSVFCTIRLWAKVLKVCEQKLTKTST